MEHALEVRGVSLRFGGVRALTDVSFGVNDGELFSIIGPTAPAKPRSSTASRAATGRPKANCSIAAATSPRSIPTRGPGSASAAPSQNLALFHHMSVLDNIMSGASPAEE